MLRIYNRQENIGLIGMFSIRAQWGKYMQDKTSDRTQNLLFHRNHLY